MSKQIIKNGIYNFIVCEECKCEFAFESTDVEINASGAKVVTCPQCGKENPSPAKA